MALDNPFVKTDRLLIDPHFLPPRPLTFSLVESLYKKPPLSPVFSFPSKMQDEKMDIPRLNDYLVVTGGSQGTEQAAETLARDYGIPVAIKIGPNHPRSSRITPLTREELNDACEPMGNAAHALTRPIPPSPIACELLLRYYYVVNDADAVFVFGYLSSSQKQVQGNTGFAVQAAIELQKRIFLYDVNFHQWYEWNSARFSPMRARFPILAPKSAILGSKAFPSKAQQALTSLFERTQSAHKS